MSLRNAYPRARLPDSHYFVSVARGDDMRTYALRPLLVWTLIALLPIAILWGAATTSYIAFHDDMIGAYLAHEADMQAAYEDKLAQSRAELDRVASRQLLDQTSFEGKMHDLLTRQARLEQRGEIVAALANQASLGAGRLAEDLAPRAHSKATESALGAIDSVSRPGPSDSVIAPTTRAYAPSPQLDGAPAPKKPRPVEDSHASLVPPAKPAPDRTSRDLAAAADNAALGAPARLGLIDYSLDRVERSQIASLAKIADSARASSARLDAVIARTGIASENLAVPGDSAAVGGPFIPLDVDPTAPAYDKAVARAARDVAQAEKLRRLMAFMPVREPLIGDVSVSSPFGYRADPFLGRPALHPGIDLVQPFGAEIRATAAGRVVHAGWMGGYGNMVEIDHGNGLATRYGHMSEIAVQEGDEVGFGKVLGKIGSTGRSTGPHLHYEVRVDGEPVDPERFLNAREALLGAP